jgi:hypothetical protein
MLAHDTLSQVAKINGELVHKSRCVRGNSRKKEEKRGGQAWGWGTGGDLAASSALEALAESKRPEAIRSRQLRNGG